MHPLTNLVTTPKAIVALALLAVLASTLACASGGCRRDDYRGVACRAGAAREDLSFGLSRDAAIDVIGRTEIDPPWKNDLGLGPAVITNPFDSEMMTSPIGEEYEIVRFYVEATGNPDCPFVQGALKLEPLIFVDDRLVGWRWSYLADVLGERISMKARRWNFGTFCNSRRSDPTEANPTETELNETDLNETDGTDTNPTETDATGSD